MRFNPQTALIWILLVIAIIVVIVLWRQHVHIG